MSKLQLLIDELNDTTRALQELSGEVAANPEDEILGLNLNSIQKRQNDLGRRIDEYLSVSQRSLVQYRIQRETGEQYPAKAVGEALERFQDLLTSVYDALVNGPKKRFRPSPDSVEKTTLSFAGATAGSVRIALAADDDRLLVGDTNLERALVLVEKALSAQTTDDLSYLAGEVGIASISRAYEWAKSAASYGLKTEISWGQSLLSSTTFEVQPEHAARITELIEHKSDDATSAETLLCVLRGFDKSTSYFHVETLEDHRDIRGSVAESVSEIHTTGKRYRAKLTRTVSTLYATGEDKERWTLEELVVIDDDAPKLR